MVLLRSREVGDSCGCGICSVFHLTKLSFLAIELRELRFLVADDSRLSF